MKNMRSERDRPMCERNFERFMRTVRCVIVYDTSRSIVFDRLTRDKVGSPKLNVKGGSLVDYMKTKGLKINPNMLGCHRKYIARQVILVGGCIILALQPNGSTIVYPLEAIKVLQGQLVPVEKLTDQASRQLLMVGFC